ncbi:MAG: amidase [Mesorhizobium sp.]|uniref:amidase family protein n=1 Tax=Mesorhizobium sp. TaxID=1871066 RepID=UPI000FE663C6|nr:amidase family protein [Mesorhizobium sp.]RWF86113.1 MAG: amidase [Mesorhizobium sp.]
MSDLTHLTISQARTKLRAKEITATEITEAYLQAIERANPTLNAYVVVTDDKARDMAKASDAKLAKGEGGSLEGIPLGIKDLFGTEGIHTQACSHVLDGFKPHYESTVTANLWADGAVMLGKLNMDEFAMGSSNETSYYGPVVNPWRRSRLDTVVMPTTHQGDGGFVSAGGTRTARTLDNAQLVPGGSSGGSASAVSALLCAGATATDTGGSIRAPASFCGLIGLRTTHGRISLKGAMPLAPSLDTFGWFARDMATYEKVGTVLLGDDRQRHDLARALALDALDGLVLGPQQADEYRAMVRTVASVLGAPRTVAPLSHSTDDLYWCFRKLQGYEAWQNHGAWISQGHRMLGPGVKERFEHGATIDLATAQCETERRVSFRLELADLLGEDGVLVLPTAPGAAPLKAASFDDLQTYRERALRLLCLSGLSGFPQITLPLGKADGAPFGLSLLGPQNSDRQLMTLAARILSAHQGSA